MTQPGPEPRIYVACLASYNVGRIHGEWIDADQDLDEIREEIPTVLDTSRVPRAEEFILLDADDFGGLKVGPYEDLQRVRRAARLLITDPDVAAAVIDYYGGIAHVQEAAETIRHRYEGTFDDLADWAHAFLSETEALKGLPEHLRCYFDYDAYGRDARLSGDILVIEDRDRIHIFWSR